MLREIAAALAAQATRAASKAAGRVLEDPRGQEALARAVGLAQKGKQVADALQDRALHAAGIAAREDHLALRKQIARIKRKARELGEKLDGEGDDEGPGDGAGSR